MMNLTKLALLTFFIGLIALIFLSSSLSPKQLKISEISGKMLDEYVQIAGEVVKVKNYDSSVVFDMQDDTDKISVISYKNISITNKTDIEVIGKVKVYKGRLELEAQKITELD
jgi:RecJ-like exonuclease